MVRFAFNMLNISKSPRALRKILSIKIQMSANLFGWSEIFFCIVSRKNNKCYYCCTLQRIQTQENQFERGNMSTSIEISNIRISVLCALHSHDRNIEFPRHTPKHVKMVLARKKRTTTRTHERSSVCKIYTINVRVN